jgi:hypothetical protein
VGALIVAAAGLLGGFLFGRGTAETTTIIRTVPGPSQPKVPHAEEEEGGAAATTACLNSPATNDGEDDSMGEARGPLKSGRRYTGTLIKGDQEWWGFCVERTGRVEVVFESSCSEGGSGATNLLADVLDSNGEEIESFRPDPGASVSIALQAEPGDPYYVHIYDLADIDVSDEACGEVPWALTVTGPLSG